MKREEYITDAQVVKRANAAVRLELEKKKAMDVPVAIYDRKKKEIYRISADGTKIVVKTIRKGRYSERIAQET